jgi:hypothetical protein
MKWRKVQRIGKQRDDYLKEKYQEAMRVLTTVFPYYPKVLMKTYAKLYADQETRKLFGEATGDDKVLDANRGRGIDG